MSVTYGIQDAVVATRNGPDDYGTAVDVPFIQMMNVAMRVISAEGTGDDRIVVVASRIIAGQGQCRMQGVPLEALEVVLGMDIDETGTTPDVIKTLPIVAGARLPAFGIIGQGLEEEGLGDQLLFVPNAKITSDVTLGAMEYGTLSSVEFTFMAIDDGEYDILNLIHRETTGAYTLPPAHMED